MILQKILLFFCSYQAEQLQEYNSGNFYDKTFARIFNLWKF